MSGLEKMDARFNNISQVPDEIADISGLKYLYLSNNDVRKVYKSSGINCTDRQSMNQLTTICVNIGKLKNLWLLNVGENQLKHLPPSVGQLQSLTDLSLNDNSLTVLPNEIGSSLCSESERMLYV